MDDRLKSGIAAIRFPMALLVVMIHCKLNPTDEWIRGVNHIFGGGISHVAVPVFFFLSGFLFLRGCDGWQQYGVKLKKRVRSVVIPYVVFNLIAIAVYCVKAHTMVGIGEFWTMMVVRPQDFPLWYLKILMVMFVTVAPLMLLRQRLLDIVLLVALLAGYLVYGYVESPYAQLLIGGTFFTLGAFCCRYKSDLQVKPALSVSLFVLSAVGLWWQRYCGAWDAIRFFNLPACLFVVFNQRFVGRAKRLSTLSRYSSFIYYTHTILVGGMVVSVLNRHCCNVLADLAAPFIVSAILIVIYEIMNRLCPRLLDVAIGR